MKITVKNDELFHTNLTKGQRKKGWIDWEGST
jgi:hypothetical protein